MQENISNQLQDNEQIDKLPDSPYSIIQNKNLFCYGSDAILLSKFAFAKNKDTVVDLCTGNGIVPLLMASHTKAKFTGIELQEESFNLAQKSVSLNSLENQIKIIHGDIKEIERFIPKNSVNVVTANPPYMKATSDQNPNEKLNIARHEIACSLDDVVNAAASLLNSRGTFYMIHRPDRLAEIFDSLKKHKLEPKRMQLVFPYADKSPTMVLIESHKGALPQLKIEPPLIMYSR